MVKIKRDVTTISESAGFFPNNVGIDRVERLDNIQRNTTDVIVYFNDFMDMNICPVEPDMLEGLGQGGNNNQSRLILRYSKGEVYEEEIAKAMNDIGQLDGKEEIVWALEFEESYDDDEIVDDGIEMDLFYVNKRANSKKQGLRLCHIREVEYIGKTYGGDTQRVTYSLIRKKKHRKSKWDKG